MLSGGEPYLRGPGLHSSYHLVMTGTAAKVSSQPERVLSRSDLSFARASSRQYPFRTCISHNPGKAGKWRGCVY